MTGGGVSDNGSHWHPARNGFLVPVQALAKLVRGKLKAALAKRRRGSGLAESCVEETLGRALYCLGRRR